MAYLQYIEDRDTKKENKKVVYKAKKNFIYKNFYNTRRWRQLRLEKLNEMPLCEMCKEKNIFKLANIVHHIIEISSGKTLDEMEKLAFDYNNLQSVCNDCHKQHHEKIINYFLFD